MKKIIVFFIIASMLPVLCFSVSAKQISCIDAKQIAQAKLHQLSKNEYSIHKIEAVKNTGNHILFFSVHLRPAGFIIVPGDDRMIPVLAYSFINNIDQDGLFIDLLINDIQKRYDALDKLPEDIISKRKLKRKQLTDQVFYKSSFQQWPPEGTTPTGGWLESNWTQNAPYNQMCPVDPVTVSRSLAGCPAVAMAMIINYHKTINSTVFTDDDDYYHNYAGRTFWIDDDYAANKFPSFPELNLYLDTLVLHYINQDPLTDNDKAALTFACGVAAKQVYTSSVSGTFGVNQAFDAYLKFNCNDIELLDESNFDIYDRLAQNMMDSLPAHLAVVDEGVTVGHNVVVDGYNTDNYFHVNFGWGGSYNAWYILPDEFPYALTVIEGLILDIMKPEPVNVSSSESNDAVIFPNPAKDRIFILSEALNISSIEIYSLSGILISKMKPVNCIETRMLSSGTYFIKIVLNTGQVLIEKVIITE